MAWDNEVEYHAGSGNGDGIDKPVIPDQPGIPIVMQIPIATQTQIATRLRQRCGLR